MDSAGDALKFIDKDSRRIETFDSFSLHFLYRNWAVDDENHYVPSIYVVEDYINRTKINLKFEQYPKLKNAIIRYNEILESSKTFAMPQNTGEQGLTHQGMRDNLFTNQEDFEDCLENINKAYKDLMEFKSMAKIIQEEAVKIPELREYKSGWYCVNGKYHKIEDVCQSLYGANEEVVLKLLEWHKAFQKNEKGYEGINVMDYPNSLESSLSAMLDVEPWSEHKDVFVIAQYIVASQSFGFLTPLKQNKSNSNKMYGSTLDASKAMAIFYNKDLARKMLFNEAMDENFDIDGEQCLMHYRFGKLTSVVQGEDCDKRPYLANRGQEFNFLIEKLKIARELNSDTQSDFNKNTLANRKTNNEKIEKIKI